MNHDEFTEVAFIFEKENGQKHSEFEEEIIKNSSLKNIPVEELEMEIVNGIQNGIYKSEAERVSAYWVLSKRYNEKLITDFTKWLKIELENKNSTAVFQILIALSNLNEPSFAKERTEYDVNETELNIRDAQNYLN